ncbi:MAG TPA: uracil-DNA glycosylase [Patescibacteria group bacterium]|jgi:DNA polymerase|nr:uracil-DNA glycosylase [Patescibacteria group bacterium]
MTKQQQLDQITKSIIDNKVCPELASTATNLVFGDGDPDAEVVFIGEAPGKNEDEQGKPFVGAAGKFLNEMLEMIELNRSQVYITNIVKYRPPGNRDPFPEEKQAFMPYLTSQLNVINPPLIVTLGRHSLNCFLPELQISSCHGQPKKYKGRVYLPLFHPAAALYNGGLRQTLIDDFAKIPAIIKIIKEENSIKSKKKG